MVDKRAPKKAKITLLTPVPRNPKYATVLKPNLEKSSLNLSKVPSVPHLAPGRSKSKKLASFIGQNLSVKTKFSTKMAKCPTQSFLHQRDYSPQ